MIVGWQFRELPCSGGEVRVRVQNTVVNAVRVLIQEEPTVGRAGGGQVSHYLGPPKGGGSTAPGKPVVLGAVPDRRVHRHTPDPIGPAHLLLGRGEIGVC